MNKWLMKDLTSRLLAILKVQDSVLEETKITVAHGWIKTAHQKLQVIKANQQPPGTERL
jgi:hypothetical protein